MKKVIKTGGLALVLILFFTTCFSSYSGPEDMVTLTIRLGGDSRTSINTVTGDELDTFTYILEIGGTQYGPFGPFAHTSGTASNAINVDVKLGEHKIVLKAYGNEPVNASPGTYSNFLVGGKMLRAIGVPNGCDVSGLIKITGDIVLTIKMITAFEITDDINFKTAIDHLGSAEEILVIKGSISIPAIPPFSVLAGQKITIIADEGGGSITSMDYLFDANGGELNLGRPGIGDNLTINGNSIGNSIIVVRSSAILNMYDTVKLTGNHASVIDNGGAVAVRPGGTFNMYGGEISGNSTENGSGFSFGGGGVYSSGTFAMGSPIPAGLPGEGKYGSPVIKENFAYEGFSITALGGGVYIAGGSFTMEGYAEISDNKAQDISNTSSANGGGVYVAGGSFTMGGDSSINGNQANGDFFAGAYGGGVYVDSGASFELKEDAEIFGNSASASIPNGIGVYNNGTFNMKGGKIYSHGGSWSSSGGGLNNNGTFTMEDGIISDNSAGLSGGGVHNGLIFNMEGGSITGNSVGVGEGGGVGNGGTFTMKGGNITGNTATSSNGGGVYSSGAFDIQAPATVAIVEGSITGNGPDNFYNDNATFTLGGASYPPYDGISNTCW